MQQLQVIVETPKGSSEKYNWNAGEKLFELNKALPVGMIFPFDFGFIPNTKGEDGDPLDALVISEFKTFPGCRIYCRLIGGITGKQQEEKNKWIRNDRFLFIPEASVVYSQTKKLQQLDKKFLEGIVAFLENYNEEKQYEIIELIPAERAGRLIKSGQYA